MGNINITYMIRILVGGYLIYLGGSIVKGLATGEADMNILMVAAAVAFIIIGIVVIISSLKNLKAADRADSKAEEIEEIKDIESADEDEEA